MKIAVPYENGQVHPHLEEAEEFKIYDVTFDEILSSELLSPKDDAGESAATEAGADAEADQPAPAASQPPTAVQLKAVSLTAFLNSRNVNVLICGTLNVATVIALRETNIQVLGGAEGSADSRVEDFLSGTLHFGSCSTCSSCAGCLSPCGLRTAAETDAPCDGNVSACEV